MEAILIRISRIQTTSRLYSFWFYSTPFQPAFANRKAAP